MQNASFTPWNFANSTPHFYSPDTLQRLDYENLQEMNQGGPLHGCCFWVDADNRRHQLPGTYGGPPIWSSDSNHVALPIWNRPLFGGADQCLAVLNTQFRKLVLFKQGFSVLQLQLFEGLLVAGIDSPIHNPSAVLFNSETAAIKRTFEL